MRRGFTLIELLVASLLLGMVVTILTMIFNQSSIAWRTGVGSVVNLNQSRRALGTFHDIRDDILPGLGQQGDVKEDNRNLDYRTVSLWDDTQRNQLRRFDQRAFAGNNIPGFKWGNAWQFGISDAKTAKAGKLIGEDSNPNGRNGFSVGVRSLGPDGEPDTPDDINTWPEEID